MGMSLKATPSPPSYSSSSTSPSDSDYLVRSTPPSLSSSPASSVSSSSSTTLSDPSWPQSDDLLTPPPSYCHQKSCYISDEDLEDLATLPLWNDVRIPTPVPDQSASPVYGNALLNAEAYGPSSSSVLADLPPPPTTLKLLPPVASTSARPPPPMPRTRQLKSAGGKRRRSKECRRKPLGIMTPISESDEYEHACT